MMRKKISEEIRQVTASKIKRDLRPIKKIEKLIETENRKENSNVNENENPIRKSQFKNQKEKSMKRIGIEK